jgi:hypothetical protein
MTKRVSMKETIRESIRESITIKQTMTDRHIARASGFSPRPGFRG